MVEYFVVIVSARPCVQIRIEAKQTTHDEQKINQEVVFGKMSHLGEFQIRKAIKLAFPIPFWQNFTNVFGRLVYSKDCFRLQFTWERKRQWNIKHMIKKANN